MNISADTGTIELENETLVLGPDLTLQMFRDSATGRESKHVGYTDTHRSYHLPAVEAHGTSFLLSVNFEGERLSRITWMDGDPSFGSTWAEWAEEKEHRRNDRHHEWLQRWGIALGEHAWGTVVAAFSERDEESSVAFIYNAESGS